MRLNLRRILLVLHASLVRRHPLPTPPHMIHTHRWEPGSYGYHGDDGRRFGGNGKGEDYGPCFTKGDTVGAAYCLANQEIFFTKNGNRVGIKAGPPWYVRTRSCGLHAEMETGRVEKAGLLTLATQEMLRL